MEAQGDGTPVWGFHPACDVPATTRMKLPGSRNSSNLSIVVVDQIDPTASSSVVAWARGGIMQCLHTFGFVQDVCIVR